MTEASADSHSDGDLVLVDAGAVRIFPLTHPAGPTLSKSSSPRQLKEHGHYIADVTRTFPVSGTFSSAQRDLYEAVLAVQRTCVSLCRQDANVSLDKLHTIATNGLRDNLKGLGFDVSSEVSKVFSYPSLEQDLDELLEYERRSNKFERAWTA